MHYRPQTETTVGTPTTLDAHEIFLIGPGEHSYQWSQLFATRYDVEYITNQKAELSDANDAAPTFTPEAPGNYRFALTTTDTSTGSSQHYELDVWVEMEPTRELKIKGAIFGDVFGELGGTQFDIAPEDPGQRAQVLDHAMNGPLRVGANWVGVVPAAFYERVLPSPTFKDEGNFLSLTDDAFYADLVAAAKAKGLKVMHTEQSAPHWDLTSEEQSALETIWEDPDWSQEWFEQWKSWIVPRAARAEKNGVDMLVLYLFPDVDTFQAPNYVEGWRDIIAEVRTVYSGTVAFNVINADERLEPLIDDLDALVITVFSGLYFAGLEDVRTPTMDEMVELTEGFISAPEEQFGGRLPIHYVLVVSSSDGQQSSEDPEWITAPEQGVDFNEQVIYYEAFFTAIEDEDWINGVFSERWDWFDQYRRSGETYEAYYFDSTREASPRSKPAEEALRLWFKGFSD